MGFEHTFPAFERAKTVHTLDRTTTVIGEERIRYKGLIDFKVIPVCVIFRKTITLPSGFGLK
jgi:hypothetical protein